MIPFKMVRFLEAIAKGPDYAPLCPRSFSSTW